MSSRAKTVEMSQLGLAYASHHFRLEFPLGDSFSVKWS